MTQGKDEEFERRALELIERHWKWIVVLVWLGFCAWFIFDKYNQIRFFGLGDTDDNMRIMQVRALLHGQRWYDLRQHRVNPPIGANIHLSRLVDLPIAGLIDHHGWQLALLALGISAVADPKRVRGGLTLGIASALSLAIGLEMLIYLALSGVAMVLFWVDDRDERERLGAYAVSLSGGTA